MIKRIIFLKETPFDRRDYDRFGVELLIKNGFYVEMWDLTFIIRPQLLGVGLENFFSCDGLIVFKNTQDLYEMLSNLAKEDFVFNLIHYNYATLGIYKVLSKADVKYAVIMANVSPCAEVSVTSGSIFTRVKNLHPLTLKKILHIILRRLPFHWFGVKPPSLIISSGQQNFHTGYPLAAKTEKLFCHQFDYDTYIEELKMPCSERFVAVFLDQNLPFHKDYIICGVKPYVSAEKYYALLKKFFHLLENRLKFKVVIAAHPRSQDDVNSNYFNGFECIKGQTVKLIRNSYLVLAHDSTSLNFANLFYKPVIFLTYHDLEPTLRGRAIHEMAKWFGKKPVYIDKDININWKEELKVNRDIYNHYRQSYIKKEGSEELPFWQIVANRLKKGFDNLEITNHRSYFFQPM